MENKFSVIGARLREQRKLHGLTQKELADKIGCTEQTCRNWEKGETLPETDRLLLLSELYSVSCDFLLCRIDEKNHDNKFIHEEIGLSEAAIECLRESKNRIMLHNDGNGQESFPAALSAIIEHDRFQTFIYRLLQCGALKTQISASETDVKEEIEAAHACMSKYGYAILAPGVNNMISLYDAKQEISAIIDSVFRIESGFIELRN